MKEEDTGAACPSVVQRDAFVQEYKSKAEKTEENIPRDRHHVVYIGGTQAESMAIVSGRSRSIAAAINAGSNRRAIRFRDGSENGVEARSRR